MLRVKLVLKKGIVRTKTIKFVCEEVIHTVSGLEKYRMMDGRIVAVPTHMIVGISYDYKED